MTSPIAHSGNVAASARQTGELFSRGAGESFDMTAGALGAGATQPAANVSRFEFPDLNAASALSPATWPMAANALVDVRVELGRSRLTVEELNELRPGSVVALDKLVGEPVDIFCQGELIARGEVVLLDENFGIRITELRAGQLGAAHDA